ncbi:hypothetical protein N7586_13975 [Acinetobacter ursingii]|nr:hypothetical protein [Acinetobacter ursingii]MDG9993311.1 hypothetical protein [Acinetobacter ursingii]MDH0205465.1 hypothetical protein [Acinetobacter ursingii]
MNDPTSLINKLIFGLMIFAFLGWFFAEQDNEILRKELSMHTGKEILK